MLSNVPFALLLTLLAGLSTGIGSAIAYFMRRPKPQYMSLVLGFSAGVMLYVSFAELLHQAFDKVGFVTANFGFFIGIVFIAVLDILVPHEYKQEHVESPGMLAVGGDTMVQNEMSLSDEVGHPYRWRRRGRPIEVQPSRLRQAGILTAVGIAIHNFPEGLVVFSSAITGNLAFGVLVAIAIAMHNIPEGISVSVPIAEATGNRQRAFLYSLAAGLAEPVGALIGYAILFPFLTPTLVYWLLAFAAGIMVYISLDELLPIAHMYGKEHFVILGVIGGMGVIAVSILFLR